MNSIAQSSCSQVLKEAQKSYEQGNLETIPDKLSGCLSNGFTKIEMLQAYRLVILSHLFLDNLQEAERSMYQLLRFEPDYKPNDALDPIEYTNLYRSFRVQPLVSFGALVGVNRSSPRVITNYGTGNTSSNPTRYFPGTNFNFGITLDIAIYKKLYATVDALYTSKSYSSISSVIPNVSEVTSNEALSNIDLPFTLKYHPGNRKLRVFIRGGAAAHLMLSSGSQVIRRDINKGQNEFDGPNVDFKSQRTPLNFSAVVGGGLTYKLGYGFLTLDARYFYGLTNIAASEKRYENYLTQITNYGYLDNDFYLDNIMLNVGYMYSIYSVKKNKKTIY
ncbi:MAG: outer membrane beta-barrel protein [Bacteroidota bacterium]|nr:outer membrane beta-barrel protein [Bacteroidota bacterium]